MSDKVSVKFDGLLNLYKPVGLTSAKALYRVRRITGIRKSGHAGTLDPAAEGVLLICMGKATKQVENLMALPKTYKACGRLDVTNPSYDAEHPFEPVPISSIPTSGDVEKVARSMVGAISQIPPQLSAVWVNGVRAYKLARKNKPVELKPRTVLIHRLSVIRYHWPEIELEVCCGRGTYIRALIRDLGRLLGVGGCLTRLCRTSIGPFTDEQATHLENLKSGETQKMMISMESLGALLKHHTHECG